MRALIRGASWLGVALIAALAFRVSYHAISGVWITSGAGRRDDAPLIPILIDGFQVIVTIVILSRALDGMRGVGSYVYPGLLVGAVTVVSVAANIAHAAPNPQARVLAGLMPLILCAATELVVRETLRTRKAARGAAPTLIVEAPVHDPAPGPSPEDATADDQAGAGPHRDAAGQRMGGQALDRRVPRADERRGPHRLSEQDDERRADHAVPPPAGGLGPLAAERGQPRVHGAGEPDQGPDGVPPDAAGSPPVRLSSIGEVITVICERDHLTPHQLKVSKIKDEVRLHLPDVSDGGIGNALTRARQKAQTNGGVKVG